MVQMFAHGHDADNRLAESVSLSPEAPYPNPTNPAVSIPFALAEPSHVRLDVYAVKGELVRVLVNEARSAGEYNAQWDGRNERGIDVSSGIYFARLEAGGRFFTRKIVVAR